MTESLPLYREFTGDNAIPQGGSFAYAFCLKSACLPAPPFHASTDYPFGTFLTPITPNGFTYMVRSSGNSAASEPTWPTALGGRVDSGTTTFMRVRDKRPIDTSGWASCEMTIRAAAAAGADPSTGAEVAHLTVGNGRLEVGFDPPIWQASHVYAEGERIVPATPNGYIFEVVNGGTSGASSPNFSTADDTGTVTLGDTVTDGGVIWRVVMEDDGVVTNLRIALDSTYTATLDPWGLGSFTLDVVDEFNERTRFAYGPAVLGPTNNY